MSDWTERDDWEQLARTEQERRARGIVDEEQPNLPPTPEQWAEARRLLSELAAWDHMDTASDGAYWRDRIRTFLSGEGSDSMKGEK